LLTDVYLLHYNCLLRTGQKMMWRLVMKVLLLLGMACMATAAGNNGKEDKTTVKVSDHSRASV
jgi:hypothetical protein